MKNWAIVLIVLRFALSEAQWPLLLTMPIGDIKHHNFRALDCIWVYIQQGHELGEDIANAFGLRKCFICFILLKHLFVV